MAAGALFCTLLRSSNATPHWLLQLVLGNMLIAHCSMQFDSPPNTAACTQAELGSPALAFVRLLVHLLALDASLASEVALLRRRLLRLVGVDEFSAAAAWVDPCLSFRLHDVICRCAERHLPRCCMSRFARHSRMHCSDCRSCPSSI